MNKRYRLGEIEELPGDEKQKLAQSFEQAQVCSGGVDTTQVNARTLESTRNSGLYFAGELLDIDGKCGGYNLQWAWSSGYVAGVNASKMSERV